MLASRRSRRVLEMTRLPAVAILLKPLTAATGGTVLIQALTARRMQPSVVCTTASGNAALDQR